MSKTQENRSAVVKVRSAEGKSRVVSSRSAAASAQRAGDWAEKRLAKSGR